MLVTEGMCRRRYRVAGGGFAGSENSNDFLAFSPSVMCYILYILLPYDTYLSHGGYFYVYIYKYYNRDYRKAFISPIYLLWQARDLGPY